MLIVSVLHFDSDCELLAFIFVCDSHFPVSFKSVSFMVSTFNFVADQSFQLNSVFLFISDFSFWPHSSSVTFSFAYLSSSVNLILSVILPYRLCGYFSFVHRCFPNISNLCVSLVSRVLNVYKNDYM